MGIVLLGGIYFFFSDYIHKNGIWGVSYSEAPPDMLPFLEMRQPDVFYIPYNAKKHTECLIYMTS